MNQKQEITHYWDRKPCNSWWSEVGWNYTEHKKLVEPHIWEWTDFPRWNGKAVLDLGCGIGTMSLEFAKAGAAVTAVDVSDRSMAILEERAREQGLAVNRLTMDIEQFRLPTWWRSVRFDLAYSFGVLHHTPYPGRALRNVRPYLERDGELWIMVYNHLGWKRLTQGRPEAQSGCPLVTFWSRQTIGRLLRATGFEPYDYQVRHIFPYVAHLYGQGIMELAFPWSVPLVGKWLHRRLEPIFGQHLLVKARKA